MLHEIMFLAADTMRSRAYAQAMAARDLRVDSGLLVRSQQDRREGQAESVGAVSGEFGELFCPDLSINLAETMCRNCGRVDMLDTATVNHPSVVSRLRESGAKIAIYSGFGGEIVGTEVLDAGPALLHVHSGWLPDYRGSTTIYYSYLKEMTVGASALLLAADIDTGPIVARRRYPVPPADIDVDYAYDSMIRADLLCRVIEHYRDHGALPALTAQNPDDGTTYYVIHPVLKHIALDNIHKQK